MHVENPENNLHSFPTSHCGLTRYSAVYFPADNRSPYLQAYIRPCRWTILHVVCSVGVLSCFALPGGCLLHYFVFGVVHITSETGIKTFDIIVPFFSSS